MYSGKSGRDKGTLFQLKQLINRTAVRADPSKDLKAVEDFFLLVWEAHVVASAKAVLARENIQSVDVLSGKITEMFVELFPSGVSAHSDHVYTYGAEVLNLGLMYHGFHDAIREGDGDRVILYWKVLLLLFKTANHHNYSKEALLLLVQQQTLPERLAEQVKWSRFVNNRGKTGCNIPCDLVLEHLSRRLKTVLHNLGANIRPNAIVRAAKSIGIIDEVCRTFEDSLAIHHASAHHPVPADHKDFDKVLEVLLEKDIFSKMDSTRQHSQFKFSHTLLVQGDRDKLIKGEVRQKST